MDQTLTDPKVRDRSRQRWQTGVAPARTPRCDPANSPGGHAPVWALKLSDKIPLPTRRVDEDEAHRVGDGRARTRCPKCGWRPRKSDLWSCVCGCSWNTFDTGGKCPECQAQWHDTQCLRCHRWSPHLDWYTTEPDGGQNR